MTAPHTQIDDPNEPYAFKSYTLEQILAAEQLARETIDNYTDEHVVEIIRHALRLNTTADH